MNRRAFVTGPGSALATTLVAEARPNSPMPLVGYLAGSAATRFHDAFRRRLRELGYVEGQNITIEYRWYEGRADRARELASELVRLRPAALVAVAPPGVMAVKAATTTIPVIFAAMTDPVQMGIVQSLARPGGNMTGVSFEVTSEVNAKLVELLKHAAPSLSRLAILWNAANPGATRYYEQTEAAAVRLGINVIPVGVRSPNDFDAAFRTLRKELPNGAVVLPDPLTIIHHERIIRWFADNRVPAMYGARQSVEDGGLMSYGTNLETQVSSAATYLDKILRGAKPADLPVEQPSNFELVINLKTAKALGLTIPQSLLLRADQVIE